jgi:hypothetical protein
MVTVLEDGTTEEQSSVVFFMGKKDLIYIIFIKKCFMFAVGILCPVKRFTTGREIQGRSKVADGARPLADVSETTVKKTCVLRVSTHW